MTTPMPRLPLFAALREDLDSSRRTSPPKRELSWLPRRIRRPAGDERD